ncbi:hypothetical protein K493DRAFT_319020 [Basidiobolus meristosporus CBS 931.73]|uniref:Uncharacterized protein n=1 Tax=Basidiobolus meristosporus CBS 931.73 TaxID=1314790 RepID=A0A1Y1XTG2_9FUNG|nr:hypothetical protein K493DRAFT_319020 [Basidiobolus meristosporus CBS 931.73]|eukprot:ORX89042.1 hypothetical protein K493DRAFT_319020 [Basidiobolus meristosporus CBS 931.73]
MLVTAYPTTAPDFTKEYHSSDWEYIQNMLASGQILKLPRSAEVQRKYEAQTQRIKQEYGSMAQYIQQVKLGWVDSKGDPVPGEDFKLLPNDFPYKLDPTIQHLVLWCRKPFTREEMAKILSAELPGKEFLFFVNPKALQSIRTVYHAQVMVRDL